MWVGQMGEIDATEHPIGLKPGAAPSHKIPYIQVLDMRYKTARSVKDKLDEGFIEPVKSEWEISAVLVPKHEGKMRFCVKYRKLNLSTVAYTYPIPRMDHLIDSVGVVNVFTHWMKNVAIGRLP